jgi:ligand-binding sensor domain-containing protein/signal transduction histidine kinase
MIVWNGVPIIKSQHSKIPLPRSSPTAPYEGLCHVLNPIRCILIAALCAIPCSNAYAQQRLAQFKHLTVDDGLSSSIVTSIIQDYQGFLWFGTYDGLNRYDGTRIVTYQKNPSDSTSLIENHVHTIFEDRTHNLYIGTRDGLVLYNRETDRFVNYKFDRSSPFYNIGLTVVRIMEDTLGNLWLATSKGAIYYNRLFNKITAYQHNPTDPHSISHNTVEYIYRDNRGRLWMSTAKGIDLFEPETGTFRHITHCVTHNETINNVFFMAIAQDLEGNIWFGSDDGLFCLENNANQNEMRLKHFRHDPQDTYSLSLNRTRSLYVDENGLLWVGTENGGINIYDKEKQNFSHYRIDDYNPMSLNNESIHALVQDRQKNMWIGTYGGGANVCLVNSDFIIHYKKLSGAAQSLSSDNVSSFVEDSHNRIWVGTDGNGFNLFDRSTGRFTRFTSQNTAMQSNAINCMFRGAGNCIWMGTWEGGLIKYDYANDKLHSFTTQNSGISDNTIYSIAQDTIGDLWLCSYRHGLIRYRLKQGAFVEYSTENSDIPINHLDIVRIDHNGHILLGSNQYFQTFIPEENRVIKNNIVPDTSLPITNTVNDILIENDTCTWVATQYGLYRFNQKNREFRWYFKADGLPSSTIKGLALDRRGILWLTTNCGLCRFDHRNNKIINFSKSDGLQGNEFNKASILMTTQGNLLAGGTNGFNLIHPDRYSENRSIPPVVITDFRLFNEKVNVGGTDSPLQKQISMTKSLTLTYKQSVLTFSFAALDFSNPQKNQYAYRMEKFDKDWTYCGNRHEATYTNLNPGRYRFHVKGSNNDGIWNETGATLEIVITPPWWKTKTARIGFVFSVLFLFMAIYAYRINQVTRQQKALKKLVRQRTLELEETNQILFKQTKELIVQTKELQEINSIMKEQQHYIDEQNKELSASNNKLTSLIETKDKLFSIVAHDLKNPFSSILGIHEILARRYDTMNEGKRKQLLGMVYTSSIKIYKLLETLLDWARTQTGKINFNPEEFVLNELIDDTIVFVENLASEKKIEINRRLENTLVIFADKNMFTTIIRNLITNAIKFTENGTIRIEADKIVGATRVKIIDSGVGISPENSAKLFSSSNTKSTFGTRGESGTGLGLIICKEFIERHGGSIAVESEIGKGSTFYVTIPNQPANHQSNNQPN